MCNQCDTNEYIAIEAVLSKHDEKTIGNLVTSIQRVRNLHVPVNGPYDNTICEHCTTITLIERPDAPEYAFILYPCPTVNALDVE